MRKKGGDIHWMNSDQVGSESIDKDAFYVVGNFDSPTFKKLAGKTRYNILLDALIHCMYMYNNVHNVYVYMCHNVYTHVHAK